MTYHSRVAGVEWGLEALLFSFSSSVTQNILDLRNKIERHKYGRDQHWRLSFWQTQQQFTGFSSVKPAVSALTVFVLLTFVVGHVPQRRVTRVSLALTLVEASFNPALWKNKTKKDTDGPQDQETVTLTLKPLSATQEKLLILLFRKKPLWNYLIVIWLKTSVSFFYHFPLRFKLSFWINFLIEPILSGSSRTKLYLHKQWKSPPIQDTLNVTNVTGRADNNRLYGQRCSHGSIWDVFTRTAGIQHCSQGTTSVHTRLKEPAHITEAVCWNRGHCPVLISTLEIAQLVCFLWASSSKTPKLSCRNSLISRVEIHFESLLCLEKGIQRLINVIKKEIVHEENFCCGSECNKAFLEHFFVIIRRKSFFFFFKANRNKKYNNYH